MKKYGTILIENVPDESTQFLKALCTNYRPSNQPLVDQVKLRNYKTTDLYWYDKTYT